MPLLFALLLALPSGALPTGGALPPAGLAAADTLLTTAEASGFRATTRHADVLAFLDALAGERVHVTTFGESYEGRALPLAVVGAEGADDRAVRATGRLRVLVVGNIHAGEVAGKEAALILLRELAAGQHAAWTDSLTLLFAPIFNADGNERIDPRNRPLQHGPVDGMGTRANAQGLDLNRDFEKLDAPETRAMVALLNTYDPHVVLDLHTTNGTVHAYHLTYAGPLHPSTEPGLEAYVRERWLPAVQASVRARSGYETFEYGNDKPEWGLPSGWATFDPRPRFFTNYVGLRNRVGLLSEAYSYATFEERILATHAFVRAVLDYAHAHAGEVARTIRQAEREPVDAVATRSAGHWARSPEPGTILLGEAVVEPNPHTGEPMWRRTDARHPTELTLYLGFEAAETKAVPYGYLVPADLEEVTDRLAAHGVHTVPFDARVEASRERGGNIGGCACGPEMASGGGDVRYRAFRVDSVRVSGRLFQGRHERELFGRYEAAEAPSGDYLLVPMDVARQPRARLAALLLEPRSDSGLAGWGILLAEAGDAYPVLRAERSAP
jgi:hypothetical protein